MVKPPVLPLDKLPALLHVAAQAGGLDAARRLIKALGGRRLYIPKNAPPNHPLVLAAGRKAADAICRKYHGDHVELPRAKTAAIEMIVAEMHDKSANEIAIETGYTHRGIKKVRARLREVGGVVVKFGPKASASRARGSNPAQIDIEDILAKPR